MSYSRPQQTENEKTTPNVDGKHTALTSDTKFYKALKKEEASSLTAI